MHVQKSFFLVLILSLLATQCMTKPSDSIDQARSIDKELREALAANGVQPIEKPTTSPAKVELGRMLFWDKIISGNRNISCATCHLPQAATADALPLSIGEGGADILEKRTPPKDEDGKPVFIARNATDIFNRGNFVTMFWDGRVMERKDGKYIAPVNSPNPNVDIWSPAGVILPSNLESALAAQAMFPPTSAAEMRGDFHENNLGKLKKWEWEKIWTGLIERLLSIEEYKVLFQKAYPDVPLEDLTFAHAANAIAAFEIDAFTLVDAPFDKYLQGDDDALDEKEKRGALLFYGKANCGNCHSGPLMTDQIFHNRIVPQIGPGKGRDIPTAGGSDGTWDFGRGGVTGWTEFFYCFRTPPLRNVERTGPWMHDGAFTDLESVVRHELDPKTSAYEYDPYLHLPEKYAETCRLEQTVEIASTAKPEEIEPISLTDEEVKELIVFLKSLTSPSVDGLVRLVPSKVPSGLPVED